MNARKLVTLSVWILSIVAVCGVLLQRQELTALQAQREQMPRSETPTAQPPSVVPDGFAASQNTGSPAELVSSELLRLRSEITRLSARKRELGNVPEEGERLRARMASAETNAPSGLRLPPGYIRKAEAQFVNYSTPENTIQSLLWALQRHDLPRFLEALLPEEAQSMRNRIAMSGEAEAFKGWDALPGMAVQSRHDLPDGTVELQVEIGPGLPPQKIQFRQLNGEWKLDDRF